MDNELAARVISLQQQVIELQEQLAMVQDDLSVSRQQCLSFYFMIQDIKFPNHEFIGILETIDYLTDDVNVVLTIRDGHKGNRYVIDARRFKKRNIFEGAEVQVTGNIADIVTLQWGHQRDHFIYAIPVAMIREII